MKWKRDEPGHYSSGSWLIQGKDRHWTVYDDGNIVASVGSYDEGKKLVEQMLGDDAAPELDAIAEAEAASETCHCGELVADHTETTGHTAVPMDRLVGPTVLEKGITTGRGTVSLDSALRSLRLSVDQLSMGMSSAVAVLNQVVERLDSLEKGRGKK